MISVIKKDLPKSQVELTITVPKEDLVEFLRRAGERLSQKVSIKGFRKGRVPYDILKQQLGEEAILHEASQEIIQKSFYDAVTKEQLETVGQPEVKIEKVSPDKDLIYTATVAILPSVTLGELSQVVIEPVAIEASEKDIEELLTDLQKKRAKEKLVLREARMGDLVKGDIHVFQGGVPIEGGQSLKHDIDLGAGMFIPGFEEQVVGMTAGQERKFTLTFPGEYHQKELAGKPADFTVKVHDVFERELPPLNDEFAKNVGAFSGLQDLRDQMKKNLSEERVQKEKQRQEIDAMDQLVGLSTFGEIPDVLIDSEIDQMIEEMKQQVTRQGLKFEDYLTHIKKTAEDLRADFRENALQRIKTSLVARALIQKEKLDVPDEEVQKDIDAVMSRYADFPEWQKQFQSPHYREHVRQQLLYRKVFALLLERAQKKPVKAS